MANSLTPNASIVLLEHLRLVEEAVMDDRKAVSVLQCIRADGPRKWRGKSVLLPQPQSATRRR